MVHPSKILITGKNRVRINGAGVVDVLQPEAKSISQQQVCNASSVVSSRCVCVKAGTNALVPYRLRAPLMCGVLRALTHTYSTRTCWRLAR